MAGIRLTDVDAMRHLRHFLKEDKRMNKQPSNHNTRTGEVPTSPSQPQKQYDVDLAAFRRQVQLLVRREGPLKGAKIAVMALSDELAAQSKDAFNLNQRQSDALFEASKELARIVIHQLRGE